MPAPLTIERSKCGSCGGCVETIAGGFHDLVATVHLPQGCKAEKYKARDRNVFHHVARECAERHRRAFGENAEFGFA